MYTEKSADLKNDFYSRYGEAPGTLYFERVGLPCVLLDCGTHTLAFAMGCGVRAYGRQCGDVLRIINADSDECDVHFAPHGKGAQVLYKTDMPDMAVSREAEEYVIMKLLCDMRRLRPRMDGTLTELCDLYGSHGWCAYVTCGIPRQLPLPLLHKRVLLIRTERPRKAADKKMLARFSDGERMRIVVAAQALKKCREDVLFDMINESQHSAELLFGFRELPIAVVRAARGADGVCAARVTDMGVVAIVEEDKTDSAIRAISAAYKEAAGRSAEISVVK